MKTFVRYALLLLAVIVACQTGIALAGDFYWVSSEKTDAASAAGDQKAAAPAKSQCCPEESICSDKGCCDNACDGCVCSAVESCRTWYVDYRIQQMLGYTSYQFGTGGPWHGYPAFDPLSKLDYSLNSTWTGVRFGVQRCNWDVHLEWLIPMVQHIDGGIKDYDWNIHSPYNDPTRLDSLSHSATRWNDGQKIELEADYKYSECFLGMPIEVWPLAGFRFQRFDMTAYGGEQIIPPTGPFNFQGDALTLNQQYYIGYIGFQLRRTIERECRPPVNLAFQFDWGGTAGYMVDHHLIRETDMYTMESTGGDTLHLGLSGDIPLNCHLKLGLQADYLRIRTTGTIRQQEDGVTTYTGNHGVLVKSEQTDITAYLQYTF
jgi:outer membrane protease